MSDRRNTKSMVFSRHKSHRHKSLKNKHTGIVKSKKQEEQDYCVQREKEEQVFHDYKECKDREYSQQQQQLIINFFNKMQAMPPPTAYHYQN